jgi:hypothetical protein
MFDFLPNVTQIVFEGWDASTLRPSPRLLIAVRDPLPGIRVGHRFDHAGDFLHVGRQRWPIACLALVVGVHGGVIQRQAQQHGSGCGPS